MGYVVVDASGAVIVDPDALRHIFVELLWKTDLQGKLPFWALDNVNFVIPSSPNDFSRVGVTIDVAKFGRINIALNGTCSLAWQDGDFRDYDARVPLLTREAEAMAKQAR